MEENQTIIPRRRKRVVVPFTDVVLVRVVLTEDFSDVRRLVLSMIGFAVWCWQKKARLLLEMLKESLFHSSGDFFFAEIRSWCCTLQQDIGYGILPRLSMAVHWPSS